MLTNLLGKPLRLKSTRSLCFVVAIRFDAAAEQLSLMLVSEDTGEFIDNVWPREVVFDWERAYRAEESVLASRTAAR
jgi:hypothetical protein